MIILHDYWRSSAAYRVRIALALKGLDYERRPVDLLGGEQRAPDHQAVNPQGLVPALEIDGVTLTQSLAIIGYLDTRFAMPPLLPTEPVGRARVLALALAVACDIHPLNNLRVLRHLKSELGQDQPAIDDWYRHWIVEGLTGLERMLATSTRTQEFAHDHLPSMADCCIVPQLYNARRFECDLTPFPTLTRIEANALALPAFQAAHPDAVRPAPG